MIIKWQSGTRRLPAQSDFQLVSPPNLQPAVQTKSIQVAWRQCKGRCLHCHCLRLHTTQQTRAVQIDFLIDYFYLFTIRQLASRPHHMVSSWQLHCPVCWCWCVAMCPLLRPELGRGRVSCKYQAKGILTLLHAGDGQTGSSSLKFLW